MLSIKPITNAASASQYYSAKDNYYLSDRESLDKSTGWYGKGATDLNLTGQVSPEVFLQLLQGRMPSGQQLGKVGPNGEIEHRPATDITLSAPKSVSILALVGGDKRLLDAHHQAVRDTLDVIERMSSEARVTIGGETGFEKTNNLVISLFQHTTSRELDPLLHDHCLIMNMTKRADGFWRSLSSRSKQDKDNPDHGFREIIYKNQHYFGLVYMSSLAKGTCDLGYGIEIKDRFGNFEITGLSQEYIERSSKRRQQIKDSLDEKGLTSAKAAEKANLDTRRTKESVDSQSINDYWKADAKAQGIDLEALIEQSKINGKGNITPLDGIMISGCAMEAVSDALEHMSPFRTKIKHADLVRTAFMFSTGTIHHEEIEAEIAIRFNEKKLMGVASDYYTTHDLLQQEKAFVKQAQTTVGVGFSVPCFTSGVAANMLASTDRLQLIDVNGLTHEKNLIESLVHTTEEQGLKAVVLHVGRLQTNRLSDSISRDNSTIWKAVKNFFKPDLVQTVAGFSARYDKANPTDNIKNDVLIVHDAQKLSYRDLSILERLTARTDSKLVLLNNTRSSEGYSAGSPINALKAAGFKSAVSKTHEKNVVVDIVQTTKSHLDLAEHYAKLPTQLREKTQVLALTNKDCVSINTHIRGQLQRRGVLSHQTKTVDCLSAQTLSDTQKKHGKFYDIGDRITFNAFTREQEHYRVCAKEGNTLHLATKSGTQKTIELNADNPFMVTKHQTLALSVGEQLVTEKSIQLRRMRIERGETLSVSEIREDGVVMNHKKMSHYFSNQALGDLSLAYDYARKPSSIAKNADSAMIALTSYQLNKNTLGELADFAPLIKVFTEDKNKAIAQLDKSQINWTIGDVAMGAPSLLYRDIAFANDPMKKDLETLSAELCKNSHNMDASELAHLAVSYASAKLSERDAAFAHTDLLTQSMYFALGKTRLSDIEVAIQEKATQGSLLHADTHWISKDALDMEKKIVANNLEHQEKLIPISDHTHLLSMPATLTQGQKDAISLVLTTSDRFVSVQGLAGVGKTTMMRQLQKMANEKGMQVVGLAPMHTSKDEMIANGINAMTIAQFLTDDTHYSEKTQFIIDESSMVGNRDYLSLQQKISDFNARGMFAGDITQLQSATSGIPHELTVKTGSQKIAHMNEIVRQKDSPVLLKAVHHASNREIEASFATLSAMDPENVIKRQQDAPAHPNHAVINIDCRNKKTKKMDYSPIYNAVATDYLTRIPEHQEKTMIIAHTHEDRKQINALIREGLQKQGRISTDEINCVRLPAKSMTKPELMHAKNYEKGDVLRFDANFSVAEKGSYFLVDSISPDSNHLYCTSNDGHQFKINPAVLALKARMSVYTREECKLAAGDKIRLRLTDKPRGHIANTEYTVEHITNGYAHLQNHDKTNSMALQLNNKQDCHWDYAYSRTAFGAQSATVTFVIALEMAKRQQATTHRSHEIDITRPRMQATIYTENKSRLIERMAELKGDKLSAYQLYIKEGLSVKSDKNQKKTLRDEKQKPAKRAPVTPKPPSAQDINEALTLQIKALSERLLGTPNRMSTANNLRFGAKGSLSINTTNGLWNNFETGEKGNALQLISVQMGFNDFKDTLDYAKDFLNCPDTIDHGKKPPKSKTEKTEIKESDNKKAYAKKLYDNSLPIKGTLAERYLKEFRQLTDYFNADFRFMPNMTTWHGDKKTHVPALLCIAKDSKGEFNHLQVIRLNPLTGDKDTDSRVVKQTYGAMNGCPIVLNKTSKSQTTYLTEGVETGLSIFSANPHANVLAMIGKSNFKNVDLSRLSDKVVLCLDNDGKATFKDSVIEKTVLRLSASGKSVSLMIPKQSGDDFNDVLKRDGVSGIKQHMNNTVDAKSLFSQTSEKQMGVHEIHENPSLIKKLLAIENNQVANLKSLDQINSSHLKHVSTLQKDNDVHISNKINLDHANTKIQHHKVMEKEMG